MLEGKFILLHGFTREELSMVMKAVKSAVSDPGNLAFALTTDTNMEWKVRDLVREVTEEHEYMKKHPPGRDGQDPVGTGKPEM